MKPEPSNSPVQPGDIVAGKYRIERLLGRGGIGVVMAAHHLALDEAVALKFIGLNLASEGEMAQRLLREARATFRLRSKHAVRVFDADELPSGAVYIVMELLVGRDLRMELAERGPLHESEVIRYALQVCDALEEAHGLGIVHRDLKPHNLFLVRQRQGPPIVKVLDFGLSKVDPELFEGGPLTQPETALGTPNYMAPEQWRSAATVDGRADIWALGVAMYELLTGRVPLQELGLAERHARMVAGAIPSPRLLQPGLSEGTAKVILRCLKADPVSRWRSAAHLANALRGLAPATPIVQDDELTTQIGITTRAPDLPAGAAAPKVDAPRARPGARSGRQTLPDSPAALDARLIEPALDEKTLVETPRVAPANPPSQNSTPSVEIKAPGAPSRVHVNNATLRSASSLSEAPPPRPVNVVEVTVRLPTAPRHPSPPDVNAESTPPPSPEVPSSAQSSARADPGSEVTRPKPRLGEMRVGVTLVLTLIVAAIGGAVIAWALGR